MRAGEAEGDGLTFVFASVSVAGDPGGRKVQVTCDYVFLVLPIRRMGRPEAALAITRSIKGGKEHVLLTARSAGRLRVVAE